MFSVFSSQTCCKLWGISLYCLCAEPNTAASSLGQLLHIKCYHFLFWKQRASIEKAACYWGQVTSLKYCHCAVMMLDKSAAKPVEVQNNNIFLHISYLFLCWKLFPKVIFLEGWGNKTFLLRTNNFLQVPQAKGVQIMLIKLLAARGLSLYFVVYQCS